MSKSLVISDHCMTGPQEINVKTLEQLVEGKSVADLRIDHLFLFFEY